MASRRFPDTSGLLSVDGVAPAFRQHLISMPTLLLLVAVLPVIMFVQSGIVIVAAAAAAIGLLGTRQAMAAILVLLLLRIVNPGLVPQEEEGINVVSVAALLACSIRIWFDGLFEHKLISDALPPFTAPYMIVILVLSALFSGDPRVSILKAVSFFIPMGAVVIGMYSLSRRGQDISGSATSAFLFVLVLSVPTLLIPSIGYLRDGMGFQGILNHPQGLAVFLAPVVALTLIRVANNKGTAGGIYGVLFLLSFAFMWLTRGRTGIAAMLLGFLLLLIFRPGFRRSARALVGKVLSRPWVLLATLFAVPLLLMSDISFPKLLMEFIFKGYDADGLSDAYEMSRGFIVDQAIVNFQSSPLTGIGFGVSNSFTHAFSVDIDPVTGLPIGAATEKANLILAVVEETGIVGTVMFLPFIIGLVRRIAGARDLAVAWCGMAALCTNISEVTFFSFGGIGLYTWLLMGWALAEYERPTEGRMLAQEDGHMPATAPTQI